MPEAISVWPTRIAHRGASALAPENTLAALRLAHALGACWVEFDVALSADGEAVVIHDRTVNRTTDGSGRVRTARLAALRQLDAGRWFSPQYAGERIPTLTEWLHLANQLGVHLNIELKCAKRDAKALAAAVAMGLQQQAPFAPQLLYSSGEPDCLKALQAFFPHASYGLIADRANARVLAQAKTLGCQSLHVNQRYLQRDNVQAVQQAGFKLLAWTVNQAERARALASFGVDGIFSDVVP
jgi:glycerophosphoryl diester phosphodiesterase